MGTAFRNSDLVKAVVVRFHGGKEEVVSDAYVVDQLTGILSFYSLAEKVEFDNIKNMEDHSTMNNCK